MNNGWVKLHRKFIDWEWYNDINTKVLFLHLLILANHKDKMWQGMLIKSGQLVTGRNSLSSKLGLSEQAIRTSLCKLKSTSEITIQSTNRNSIITLVKWEEYQTKEKNQPANQPANQPTNNHKQECKEYKEEKNILQTDVCEVLPDLLKDEKKHIQIIGLFAKAKRVEFENKKQLNSFIKRNLRPAQLLVGYRFDKIIETMKYLMENSDFKWTIESVSKYIDEDLTTLNINKKVIQL